MKLKRILGIIGAVTLVLNFSVTPVYASYIQHGYSIRLCYSNCGQYMGAAALDCEFEYVDGSYVKANDVSVYFEHNKELNYDCLFSEVDCYAKSSSYAVGYSKYYARDGYCSEYGELKVTCDEYGNIEEYGQCLWRECDH